MKKVLALALALSTILMSQTSVAAPSSVPRCWASDQPDQDIQDGLFQIFIPTASSSLEVANVLALLMPALAHQAGVATTMTLDRIEIDMQADLSHWQSSATFPTLDSFKDGITESLAPALSQSGVTIQCAEVNRHFPIH